MARADLIATAKVRARKDGAAVALDDHVRKLLNLMACGEEEVLARVTRLLSQRIIRQVTPIYDTRALGYGSMLVAAKVDAEHPWAAAKIMVLMGSGPPGAGVRTPARAGPGPAPRRPSPSARSVAARRVKFGWLM